MKKAGLTLIGLFIAAFVLTNEASAEMKYKIIYEDTLVRLDNCKTYFVLIDPINLKNDNFKKEIMELVRSLAKQKGRDISIDIFDDQRVMKKYIKIRQIHFTAEPPEPLNVKEERHHVARFDDYSNMGTWLSFFPTLNAYNNDYNLFGKYHDFFVFNPYE